jgi:ribosome-binding ATPase YchF (GTP1/OBG family)
MDFTKKQVFITTYPGEFVHLLEDKKIDSAMDLAEKKLKQSNLLTYKQFVYACNVNEDMMDASESQLRDIIGVQDENIPVIPVCAKLESDVMEMEDEERVMFLEEMGLKTSGLDDLIKASYDALGLQYYFTA